MKFTLSWLKEHLETDRSVDEITETLSMIGLEVEGIEDKAKALAPFVVGYVSGVRQHPNADRLKLCTVDMGSGTFEVVIRGKHFGTDPYITNQDLQISPGAAIRACSNPSIEAIIAACTSTGNDVEMPLG